MSAPRYLTFKYVDSMFAVAIGASAAWLRIRREEVARNNGQPVPAEQTWSTLVRRTRNIDPRNWDWKGKKSSWGIVDP